MKTIVEGMPIAPARPGRPRGGFEPLDETVIAVLGTPGLSHRVVSVHHWGGCCGGERLAGVDGQEREDETAAARALLVHQQDAMAGDRSAKTLPARPAMTGARER